MDIQLKTYAEKVKELRTAQDQYFQARRMKLHQIADDWLKKCKKLEKEVDEETKKILAPSVQQNLL